ncbi:tetratricopeptide (TPR) repeat protein [Croceifilum oryzae]|uniref:Tetratricopeptide (TPR) repeat protein n=1 Tax=Croceifilum oryzae TaxID=1553429 RepID=A0AAJ1TCY3_9BACL|nr:hypothetical protein [Croceifilum oryzae]MDQ0416600.1 tetratricopeptide (TPR) repeat protein [Croceifilum oryzae]
MMDYQKLLRQAASLPDGDAKLTLMEEAIRMLDSLQEVDNAFYERMNYINIAVFLGRGEKAIVAFAWCLAQYDKEPGRFVSHNIMWTYKWIAEHIQRFPQISVEKVEETLADLKRRYQELGYKLRPYYWQKRKFAFERGDLEEAEKYFQLWMEEPRDRMSDCRACERDHQVSYYLEKDLHRAEDLAKSLFQGWEGCRTVPSTTYADFLLPTLQAGKVELAWQYYQTGYPLIRGEKGFIPSVAKHIQFLTVVDKEEAAILLQRHLPEALSLYEKDCQFQFFLAASILFEEIGEYQHTLNIPDHVTYEWLTNEVESIAKKFDGRNGNDGYQKKIIEVREKLEACRKMVKPR